MDFQVAERETPGNFEGRIMANRSYVRAAGEYMGEETASFIFRKRWSRL